MELTKESIKSIVMEVKHLAPNMTSYELKYISNSAGDEYKIFLNDKDMSSDTDLFLQIWELVDDFDSAHRQIITELIIKFDSSSEPIITYKIYDGDRNEIVRYEPLE